MSPIQLTFLAVAAFSLVSALMVVTRPNMVHAALYLVVASFGVAALFVLLGAPYLAVIQVVVYIGAIAILMIIAIMLTRRIASEDLVVVNAQAGWAAVLAAILFFSLLIILGGWDSFGALAGELPPGSVDPAALGEALVSPQAFVIPFEVASVLLLAALIGAIVIAWRSSRAGG
ncbi:MAG: NADH-quinone oxidoreductase subunit J [Anaerolineae bacterium]|jgi:NADH-quinone oxidoreductase subunit J|nr:NADH-quinone oxidoreductase subunit J [Anaerolineae bacterium]